MANENDIDAATDKYLQARATSNAASGASPADAVAAREAEPLSGVPASQGMLTPAEVTAAANARRAQAIQAASPHVTSFNAASPVNAASSSDSLGPMANLGSMAGAWTNNWGEVRSAFSQLQRTYQTAVDQGHQGQAPGGPLGLGRGGIFNLGGDLFNLAGAVGQDIVPPIRGVIKGEQFLGQAVPAGIVDTFGPTTSRNLLQNPFAPPTVLSREDSIRQLQGDFGTALLALGAEAPKVAGAIDLGRAFEVAPEPPGPPGRGLPGPKGSVPPVEPATPPPEVEAELEPGPFTSDPGRPEVANPLDAPVFQAEAEASAQHVARMEDTLAETPLFSRDPALMEDYLANHTEAGERSAYVNAGKALDLLSQHSDVLGLEPSELLDALVSGSGEVEMPLSRYLVGSAGKPWAEELRAATRFDPEGISQEQAKGLKPETVEPSTSEVAPVEVPEDLQSHAEDIHSLAAKVDATVAEVFKSQGIEQLFTSAKAAGLTKDSFERYGEALDSARTAVRNKVLQATYAQLRAERTPEWKANVDAIEPFQRQLLEEHPDVQALKQLSQVGFKLDRDFVASAFPGSASRLPPSILKKGGNNPDDVADHLGYNSAAQMLSNLADLHDTVQASGAKGLASWITQQAKDAAVSQARTNLGYDVTPNGLWRAAQAATAEVPMERFLIKELQDFAQEKGLPFQEGDVRALAKEQFNQLLTKDATNVGAFSRKLWSLGNATQAQLEKGVWAKLTPNGSTGAFLARQRQLINYFQYQMAAKAAKEFRSLDGLLSTWADAKTLVNQDPGVGAILQQATANLNYSLARNEGELLRYVAELRDEGRPWDVQSLNTAAQNAGWPIEYHPQPAAQPNVPNPKDPTRHVPSATSAKLPPQMKWGEFSDYMDQLKALAKFGRELQSINVHGEQWTQLEFGNNVQVNAVAIGRKFTPAQLVNFRTSLGGKAAAMAEKSVTLIVRPETYLHWLDGDKQGPLMKAVVNPLMAAQYHESDLAQGWSDAMHAAVGKPYFKTLKASVEAPDSMDFKVPGQPSETIPIITNRGQLVHAALHLGSQSGRTKLLAGYDWSPAAEDWIKSQLTPEDQKFIEAFWAENEKLFKLSDAMYRRLRDYGLPADQLRPVKWADGSISPGGHVNIQYNSTLQAMSKIVDVNEGTAAPSSLLNSTTGKPRDPNDQHPAAALPSSFYGIQRTNYVGPVLLSHTSLVPGISQTIHDIAFREALINAQKAFDNPLVQQAMDSVLGPSYHKQMFPWLQYIASERLLYDPGSDEIARFIRRMGSNATFAQVAFSFSSALKHGQIGWTHMLGEIKDPLQLATAIKDTLGLGLEAEKMRQFVRDNSGVVRTFKNLSDTSIREMLNQDPFSGMDDYRKAGSTLFNLFKNMEAYPTWLARYRIEMNKTGDHPLSVAAADKAVRDTQGGGGAVDLAPALRRTENVWGEFGRTAFGRLFGFRNTSPNRYWTAAQQLGQAAAGKNVGQNLGRAAATYGSYGFLAALLVAAYTVFEQGGGDPKEKNPLVKFGKELAWGALEQTAGVVPYAGAAVDQAKYGKQGSEIVGIGGGQKIIDAFTKPHRKIANAIGGFGELTGLSTVSMGNFLQAIADEFGNDLQPGEKGPVEFFQRAILNATPHYKNGGSSHSGRKVKH